MLKFTCNLMLVILTIMLVHQHCGAQTEQEKFLAAHSSARTAVGVAPLVWSVTVANYAQRYADSHRGDCRMVHSGGPYGENLAWSSGELLIAQAVQMWVDEKKDYDYGSNTCRSGAVCGHYTQVVWRNSKSLGCAKVRCNNGGTLITCNYDPPGNYINQRPY
ncbi:unnamed protein product [Rhodiola kirilowii]